MSAGPIFCSFRLPNPRRKRENEDFFEKIWRLLPGHAIISAYLSKDEGGTAVPQGAKWKVIHMARSEKHAGEILALLEREGILARSRQVYRTVSSEENYYEIMVLGAEAMEAQQLLIENNLLL